MFSFATTDFFFKCMHVCALLVCLKPCVAWRGVGSAGGTGSVSRLGWVLGKNSSASQEQRVPSVAELSPARLARISNPFLGVGGSFGEMGQLSRTLAEDPDGDSQPAITVVRGHLTPSSDSLRCSLCPPPHK
ncbi:mCG147571 [Mus musculus]|nr:mCG147571 [Mus musculus]